MPGITSAESLRAAMADQIAARHAALGLVLAAPWLQAMMIGQAGIAPGMRVLEIGSGGYNAALLREVVGASGSVTTVDVGHR